MFQVTSSHGANIEKSFPLKHDRTTITTTSREPCRIECTLVKYEIIRRISIHNEWNTLENEIKINS